MKYEDMYVKEVSKTEKDKEDGVEVKHKMTLEKVGDDGVKIVITSDNEFDISQGEKGLTLEMKSTQTKLGK